MASGAFTGRQILERWGMLPYELIETILAGNLVAVNTLTGEKHSKENDNCFFCTRDMGRYYSLCNAQRAFLAWNNVEGTCSNSMRAEYRDKRLAELKFLEREVLTYEQTHGLRSATTLPTSAPAPGQDSRAEMEARPSMVPLPTPPGTTWGQIRIRIAKRNRIEIWRPGYDMQDYSLDELGLAKARNKMAILKEFGRGKRKLKRGIQVASPQNISNLRKYIKSIFPHVEGDPIVTEDEMYKKNYVCQFEISVSEEVYSEEYYTHDEAQDDGEDWEELIKNNR